MTLQADIRFGKKFHQNVNLKYKWQMFLQKFQFETDIDI